MSFSDEVDEVPQDVLDNPVESGEKEAAEGMESDSPEPEAAEAEREDSSNRCPHCGWDLSMRDPIEVSEADIANFVRSVLANKRFEKSYMVFGDHVRVKFRSLMDYEEDKIGSQIRKDMRDREILSDEGLRMTTLKYCLLFQLVSYQIGDQPVVSLPDERVVVGEPLMEAYARHLKLQGNIRGPILTALAKFNDTCDRLKAQSHNRDFYVAAVGQAL